MTAQAGGAIPSSQTIALERDALRRQLRRERRAISATDRRKASLAIARLLSRHPLIRPGARVGVYLALPGELNLQPFIKLAWQRGCRVFVPHITQARRRQMNFFPLFPHSPLQTHRWGMPELHATARMQRCPASHLDVVLVPLVGFDAFGNRLGMGAGFYDRHFARLSRATQWRRPHLLGVAYACQQVVALNTQPHDVRLEQIVTERGILHARNNRSV